MKPLPPLSADPDAIVALYAQLVDPRAERPSTAFARSVLAVINAMVAHDFEVPPTVFARLARPSQTKDTLYDTLARGTHLDFSRLAAETRRRTFADFTPAADPHIWVFRIRAHLVRTALDAPYLDPTDDPDLPADLDAFDPDAARIWHTDRAAFAADHERRFVEWRVRQNLARLDHDCGPAGAAEAVARLRADFLPYNPFYQTCIDRVGCLGLRFVLEGIDEVITPHPIGLDRAGWVDAIPATPGALHLVVPAPGSCVRRLDEFAVLPQCAPPDPKWDAGHHRRTLGVICVPATALGHLRRPGRRFERESGHGLTHEMGHIFQLYHLGTETVDRQRRGRGDFDYPAIGVAADTIWRPPRRPHASIDPAATLFAAALHDRSMFMNFMSGGPRCDDALFFTRGQAARARLFAQIHYGAYFERGEAWPDAARWIGARERPVPDADLRFDAPPGDFRFRS